MVCLITQHVSESSLSLTSASVILDVCQAIVDTVTEQEINKNGELRFREYHVCCAHSSLRPSSTRTCRESPGV